MTTQREPNALLPQQVSEATELWHCTDPHQNKKNGRSALIRSSAKGGHRPQLQLCTVDDPSPIVKAVEVSTSTSHMFVELAPGTKEQFDVLYTLDSYALNLAESNCNAWFGKTLTKDQISSMYKPLINSQTNTLLLRVPMDCSVWRVAKARQRYSTGSITDLCLGCHVLPCISINGIFFKTREMGLSVTCSALIMFQSTTSIPFHLDDGYALEERDDNDNCLPEHYDCDTIPPMQ
uniref:Uncharacterized protein n=1 Tax=viral metagenome TaxID=1070528 RepID=A0A6C0C0D8_9ZZZZ